MSNTALKLPSSFTYADYCRWDDDERWELIDGEAYAVSALSRIHQKFSFELGLQIGNYLKNKACEIYTAPFDVRLPQTNEADEVVDTVVQPDISVICNLDKLDDRGCRGAPDWIIEILSPSTVIKDMDVKRDLYQKQGVKEYWLIHPIEQWGMIYLLNEAGQYGQSKIIELKGTTPVHIFPDLSIDWSWLYES
jgi:Uma2 family endonuclease